MSIKNGHHYDDFNRKYYRNEDGSKVPEVICMCAAHEPSECCCDCTSWDCTSWDNYREDQYYKYYEDKKRKVNDYGTN